jgi:hypothetical protein
MKRAKTIAIALGFVSLAMTGCDENEQCQQFAAHLADVLEKESGNTPEPANKAKMISKTAETCSSEPPSKEALDCALAAQTSEAIEACDAKDTKTGE